MEEFSTKSFSRRQNGAATTYHNTIIQWSKSMWEEARCCCFWFHSKVKPFMSYGPLQDLVILLIVYFQVILLIVYFHAISTYTCIGSEMNFQTFILKYNMKTEIKIYFISFLSQANLQYLKKTRQSMFVKHVPPLWVYFIEATKL